MTDDELLAAVLADFERAYSFNVGPGREWLTARDALEHALGPDGYGLGIGDDCASLAPNPDRPMHGPRVPPEMRDPLTAAVIDAYRAPLVAQIMDSLPLMAHLRGRPGDSGAEPDAS